MRPYLIFSITLVCVFSLATFNAKTFQTQSGVISGTVKDPKGAVVVGAQISVRNEATGDTRNATTDGEGRFKIEGLAPGSYKLSAERAGFKTAERNINLSDGKSASVEIKLEVAETKAEVTIGAKGAIAANTDLNYRALRDGVPSETYTINNLTLKRDVGVMTLRNGSVSFLPPVLGRVTTGVFVGEGEFNLVPAVWIEKDYLKFVTGKETFNETFNRAVFCFFPTTPIKR